MIFEQYIGEALVAVISLTTGWLVGLKKQRVDTKKIEVDVLEQALQVLQKDVVQPLRESLTIVQNENKELGLSLKKLQNAINKMYTCHALANCPIRIELSKSEGSNRKGRDQRQPTNRQREPVDRENDTTDNSSEVDSDTEPHT